MVLYSSLDRHRSVELLVEHQTCELVAEDHRAERQPLACPTRNLRIEAKVGSDPEGDRVRPFGAQPAELAGEAFGARFAAPGIEGDRPAGLWQRGEQRSPLGSPTAAIVTRCAHLDPEVPNRQPVLDAAPVFGAQSFPVAPLVAARPEDPQLASHARLS